MTDPAGALRAGRRACPSCGAVMQVGDFEHRAEGRVEVDLCLDCRALWFDAFESAQLAPRGVIELFRVVQAGHDRPAHPLASALHCPACRDVLVLTHDIQHTTRFTYYRCGADHGRFTPFVQFLREKEFVRSLTPVEVQKLSATVTQIRCSSCGAPVDITREAECPYCHAPIAILDANAVQHAVEALSQQEQRPKPVDAGAVLDALLAGRHASPATAGEPVDLVHGAISMLLGTF